MGTRDGRILGHLALIVCVAALGFVVAKILLRTSVTDKRPIVTQMRIQSLEAALVVLSGGGEGFHDTVVPTDPAKLCDLSRQPIGDRIGSPNDTNLGIESVFVALHLEGVNVTLDVDEEAYGNTDGDEMADSPTRVPIAALHEFVDAWGNPFAYFSGPDMKRWEEYGRYRMADGRIETVRPWWDQGTGAFACEDGFQLFSAGPDGKFNTQDDLKSW